MRQSDTVEKTFPLPDAFTGYTRRLFGEERYDAFLHALRQTAPVSIRLNPFKCTPKTVINDERLKVAWNHDGAYLNHRPEFTFDPLLHAGMYYVQEAASMFVGYVLRQLIHTPVFALDLCAAPGGKTTAMMAALPAGSTLYSNEPVRQRAQVLAENVLKFGHPDITVTNNYPADYRNSGLQFDVILTDVPCSGEGMFRKDPDAVAEWSEEKVRACRDLQRTIVDDIWPCLKENGILIYSTCTFNAHEDEENIQWMMNTFDADMISLEIPSQWNITGDLTGNGLPVYRFIPGITESEGLFLAVLRKKSEAKTSPPERAPHSRPLHILAHGIQADTDKGGKHIPHISKALSIFPQQRQYPLVNVGWATAVAYLRHEAIALPPDAPVGIVRVGYQQQSLGFAKNIGSRANNLYPMEWRIKSTYLPKQAPEVLSKKD